MIISEDLDEELDSYDIASRHGGTHHVQIALRTAQVRHLISDSPITAIDSAGHFSLILILIINTHHASKTFMD